MCATAGARQPHPTHVAKCSDHVGELVGGGIRWLHPNLPVCTPCPSRGKFECAAGSVLAGPSTSPSPEGDGARGESVQPPRVPAATSKSHHCAAREGGSCRCRLDSWLIARRDSQTRGARPQTHSAPRARVTAQRIRGARIGGKSPTLLRARLQGKARCQRRMLNRSATGGRGERELSSIC